MSHKQCTQRQAQCERRSPADCNVVTSIQIKSKGLILLFEEMGSSQKETCPLAWRMLLVYTSVTACQRTKLSLGERHELCAKHKEKHVLGTFQAQF